jgi:hypothetical protein
VSLAKYGRKVCCAFNNEVKCLFLVDGNKLCVQDETTEAQYDEDAREDFLASLRAEGYTGYQIFKG